MKVVDLVALQGPITTLKGIGPQKAKAFYNLGIRTLEDLLYHWPMRYEDRSTITGIRTLVDGEKQLVKAHVISLQNSRISKGQSLIKVAIDDGTGRGTLLFKNAPYIANQLKEGQDYWFYGPVRVEGKRIGMFHPEYKSVATSPEGFGIVPIYSLSEGLSQSDIYKALEQLKPIIPLLEETLPAFALASIMPRDQAVKEMHFPTSAKRLKAARYRGIYEEFFHLQMALMVVKTKLDQTPKVVPYLTLEPQVLRDLFPFQLTGAQQRVIGEIYRDMDQPHCMNRLLQGDVGSGKTAVALAAVFKCVTSGHQAVVLAPTEILAKQHYDNFSRGLGQVATTALITGGLKGKARQTLLADIASGAVGVIVGTHAILQEGVDFKSLKLVITDEQHRFGVGQRQVAASKGDQPLDVLVMSATPIPRTLSLVLYGDVSMSVIDEMPLGRLAINTHWLKSKETKKLIETMKQRLAMGERAYWIAPLIEETEALDLKSLEALYDELVPEFETFGIGKLHGKMQRLEKAKVMADFASGRIQVLVATTVVEVGVDVPMATMIAITHAERFGLAQLHQLRGRVGRGALQSSCYLISDAKGEVAKARLETMTSTNDGFEIANKDLELRGPGEMIGLRQHGVPEFKLADIVRHEKILADAQRDARAYAALLGEGLVTSDYTVWLSKHLTL